MKKITSLFTLLTTLILSLFILPLCLYADSSPALIDDSKVLNALNKDNLSVSVTSMKLPLFSQVVFGSFEKEQVIDSLPELYMAIYYTLYAEINVVNNRMKQSEFDWSDKDASSHKESADLFKKDYLGNKTLITEIPAGKPGALKIASMWLFKTAEYPENKESYNKAINFIIKNSGVTKSEINEYYTIAIKKKIDETPFEPYEGASLSSMEKDEVRKLFVAYMLNPTEANRRKIRGYKIDLAVVDRINGSKRAVSVSIFGSKISRKLYDVLF